MNGKRGAALCHPQGKDTVPVRGHPKKGQFCRLDTKKLSLVCLMLLEVGF